MRKTWLILFGVLVSLPLVAMGQAIPAFPMAFWGNVTINGSPAPMGSVVRAYYGNNTLAGEATLSEAGIYGYSSPANNKLVVAEGAGEISFRIIAAGFNSGNETGGTSALTYSGFTSGDTVNKNLAFTIVNPTPTPQPVGGGGGGGGGGGALPQVTPKPSSSAIPSPGPSSPFATPSPATQQQPTVSKTVGSTIYVFKNNLRAGLNSIDVSKLQSRLQQEGVYSGPITGYFGSLTRLAVSAYQKQNDLPQTGYLDAPTRQTLNGVNTGVTIADGSLIRAKGAVDIFIVKFVGAKKFKRLILSPAVFNQYSHLHWQDVRDVDVSVIDTFVTSDLVRATNDAKVYRLYPSGDTGEKRWVTTAEAFLRNGFDWDSIYEINSFDRDSYVTGQPIE